MPKTNATQRSLKHLRDNGWSCHIVEKYIKHPGMPFGRRIDAFGIGDILACKPAKTFMCKPCRGTGINNGFPCRDCDMTGRRVQEEGQIALVQCFPNTSGSGFADHREKILAIPEAKIWILAGGKIFLQGWRKGGPRGETKHWQMKQEEVIFA